MLCNTNYAAPRFYHCREIGDEFVAGREVGWQCVEDSALSGFEGSGDVFGPATNSSNSSHDDDSSAPVRVPVVHGGLNATQCSDAGYTWSSTTCQDVAARMATVAVNDLACADHAAVAEGRCCQATTTTTTTRTTTTTGTTTTTKTTTTTVAADDFVGIEFDGEWGLRAGDINPVPENASIGYHVANIPVYQDDAHTQLLTTYSFLNPPTQGRRRARRDGDGAALSCDLNCINGGTCVLVKNDCTDPNAAYEKPVCDCGPPTAGSCFYGQTCDAKLTCAASTLGFTANSCRPHIPAGRGGVLPSDVCGADAVAPALCTGPATLVPSFAINASSGQLTVAGPLDYETKPYHILHVNLEATGMPLLAVKGLTLNVTIAPVWCPGGSWSATGSSPCETWTACSGGLVDLTPPSDNADRVCGTAEGTDLEASTSDDAMAGISVLLPILLVAVIAIAVLAIVVLRRKSQHEEREKAEGALENSRFDINAKEQGELVDSGKAGGIQEFDGLAAFLQGGGDPDYQEVKDRAVKEGTYQACYPMATKEPAADEFDLVAGGVYAMAAHPENAAYDMITGDTSDHEEDDEATYDMGTTNWRGTYEMAAGDKPSTTYDTAAGTGATYDTAAGTGGFRGRAGTYDMALGHAGVGDIYDTATHQMGSGDIYDTAAATHSEALYDTACGIEAGTVNSMFMQRKESIYCLADDAVEAISNGLEEATYDLSQNVCSPAATRSGDALYELAENLASTQVSVADLDGEIDLDDLDGPAGESGHIRKHSGASFRDESFQFFGQAPMRTPSQDERDDEYLAALANGASPPARTVSADDDEYHENSVFGGPGGRSLPLEHDTPLNRIFSRGGKKALSTTASLVKAKKQKGKKAPPPALEDALASKEASAVSAKDRMYSHESTAASLRAKAKKKKGKRAPPPALSAADNADLEYAKALKQRVSDRANESAAGMDEYMESGSIVGATGSVRERESLAELLRVASPGAMVEGAMVKGLDDAFGSPANLDEIMAALDNSESFRRASAELRPPSEHDDGDEDSDLMDLRAALELKKRVSRKHGSHDEYIESATTPVSRQSFDLTGRGGGALDLDLGDDFGDDDTDTDVDPATLALRARFQRLASKRSSVGEYMDAGEDEYLVSDATPTSVRPLSGDIAEPRAPPSSLAALTEEADDDVDAEDEYLQSLPTASTERRNSFDAALILGGYATTRQPGPAASKYAVTETFGGDVAFETEESGYSGGKSKVRYSFSAPRKSLAFTDTCVSDDVDADEMVDLDGLSTDEEYEGKPGGGISLEVESDDDVDVATDVGYLDSKHNSGAPASLLQFDKPFAGNNVLRLSEVGRSNSAMRSVRRANPLYASKRIRKASASQEEDV